LNFIDIVSYECAVLAPGLIILHHIYSFFYIHDLLTNLRPIERGNSRTECADLIDWEVVLIQGFLEGSNPRFDFGALCDQKTEFGAVFGG
jgi:hypothetical protein